ncbi:4162_t:CDS:2 [Acaulospora colombiana]|uniref:4162_t:CDS:1 n=1 Tax=Acaulospora colombiana TaxID=27376 RepID=A0ACA9K9J1_9GLOM|nr:4162_t:CDS:2 [Acaulospora colombiana]
MNATSVEYRTYLHPDSSPSPSSPRPAQGNNISVEKQRQREIDQEHVKIREFLSDYFQLRVNLRERYEKWSLVDNHFARIAKQFQGIRILRQDPVENVICFICSTNNNIARISQMIEKLCRRYGQKVYTLNGQEYFDFPTLDKLASPEVEGELQKLGFGYRARYIAQTAKFLMDEFPDGERWLHSLRKLDYKEARAALLQLTGCLMSLDKHNAIPVDTHVWQIAKRKYGFGGKGETRNTKTLTSRSYEAVGDHFRKLFGDYSGWAHSLFTYVTYRNGQVLFTADLKAFEDRQNNVEELESVNLACESKIAEGEGAQNKNKNDRALTPSTTINNKRKRGS